MYFWIYPSMMQFLTSGMLRQVDQGEFYLVLSHDFDIHVDNWRFYWLSNANQFNDEFLNKPFHDAPDDLVQDTWCRHVRILPIFGIEWGYWSKNWEILSVISTSLVDLWVGLQGCTWRPAAASLMSTIENFTYLCYKLRPRAKHFIDS